MQLMFHPSIPTIRVPITPLSSRRTRSSRSLTGDRNTVGNYHQFTGHPAVRVGGGPGGRLDVGIVGPRSINVAHQGTGLRRRTGTRPRPQIAARCGSAPPSARDAAVDERRRQRGIAHFSGSPRSTGQTAQLFF